MGQLDGCGIVDGRLIFRTNLDAPRGRLVEVDADNPGRENWKELVPESEAVMRGASLVGAMVTPLAFAAVIICIMVGGSLWIMFDLYHRMMV